MKTKLSSILVLAMCAFALVANTSCSKSSDPEQEVTAISLNKASDDLYVGKTLQLTATTTPAGAVVTWSSSSASVASVDANGLVTGLVEGTTKITAKAGSKTAQCMITVYKQFDPSGYECLNGTSYYIGILSAAPFSQIESRVKADLRDDGGTTITTDIWPNGDSYSGGTGSGNNPFGENYTTAPWYCLVANQAPWEGVGAGGIRVMKDFSLSGVDGSYVLHIDYKSSDGGLNEVCLFRPSNNAETWVSLPTQTDGQWHSFDKKLSDIVFKGGSAADYYKDPYVYVSGTVGQNIFGFRTTGAGNKLEWASLFIYKPATK